MTGAALPLQALRALGQDEAQMLGVEHTLREILQQPSAWLDTLERVHEARAELLALLQRAGLSGAQPPDVVLIGAGSSDFAAQLVAAAFRERFAARALALASTDLLTQARSLLRPERPYLFVWFSRSGTTAEALELLEILEREFAGAHHLFITCNADGAFARRPKSARQSCLTLPDRVHDRGLAMTSSFTSMTLAGLLVAMGGVSLEVLRQHVTDLSLAAERLFVAPASDLFRLAERRHSSVFFLGSGSLKAAAGECALKLLELSAGRVNTRFDSFLGARHGPLSSLDRQTALVGLLSRSPAERLYEIELVREVRAKALAGVVTLFTPEGDERLALLGEPCIDLGVPRRLPEPFVGLLHVVSGQLLALFSSLTLGVRPDAPSESGAIARVVERIRPRAGGQGDAAP